MHKGEQKLEQRHESLLALYNETWEEIRRLREFEWKIAATFVTLAGAFIVLISSDSIKPLLTHGFRLFLTFAQFLAMGFGIFCLHRTHAFLTDQRKIRQTIEDVLNFHENNVFADGPILPTPFAQPIGFSFQAKQLLIPLIAAVILVQGLAIYMTWAIPAGRGSEHQDHCQLVSILQ